VLGERRRGGEGRHQCGCCEQIFHLTPPSGLLGAVGQTGPVRGWVSDAGGGGQDGAQACVALGTQGFVGVVGMVPLGATVSDGAAVPFGRAVEPSGV
jgi:hypothetical protein